MAMANVQNGLNPNHDNQEPNHMIIWLDSTIGNPEEYQHVKRAFGSNTDPRVERPTPLTGRDIDNLINASEAQTVRFEGVIFLLQAFDNEEQCLQAFENNQDKRIFFITSGRMGENIVPRIIDRYSRVFTDLITDEPYASIYVFCHNIQWNIEWAMDYLVYIQMFNFDSELLERMVRDIALYFIQRAERMRADENFTPALQRLHWAKRLWHEYDRMQQQIPPDSFRPVHESIKMREINQLIAQVGPRALPVTEYHDYPNNYNNNDDDDRVAEEPTD